MKHLPIPFAETATITILGKSYCVRKMGMDGPGLPFIYYSKDFGIIQMSLNKNVYERIP